jgi:hypothetical protein
MRNRQAHRGGAKTFTAEPPRNQFFGRCQPPRQLDEISITTSFHDSARHPFRIALPGSENLFFLALLGVSASRR